MEREKVRTSVSFWHHLQFACCGINGSSNYGTSWWRLQEVGRRELVVPLSCCTLNNANETGSFLNPEPANLTLCQALNPAEHQYARHITVCTIMRKLLPSYYPYHVISQRTRDGLSESARFKDKRRGLHIKREQIRLQRRTSTTYHWNAIFARGYSSFHENKNLIESLL